MGLALTGSTTLTIHAFHNAAYPCNDAIDFLNNSDHDVIQNISSIVEDYTRPSGFGFFCWSGSSQAPDSNLIQNNFVKQGGITLFISSNGALATGKDNIVRGNQIGSETDSLIAWGIQIEVCQNTLIENNVVQNLRPTNITERVNPGINSYSGSGDIIRNNIVHNIKPSIGYSSVGILLSGGSGSNNSIYNNMVYDISSTSPQSDSRVAGIQIWLQNSPKIYYNTVYLSGNGANHQGSAAFYIYGGWGNSTNVEIENNIFVNTRDESPYCASSIYDYTASNLTSDYNDLYYEQNGNNCLVRIGSNDYLTLADWQTTGKDLNSTFEMPNFVDPYLHIDPSIPTNIESHAIPIAGITTDFDGDTRNATTPDVGADEFQGVEGITWTTQTLPENDLMIQVKAVDLSVAWALGLHGKVFRTTDGGTTWNSVGAGIPIGGGQTVCIEAISASTAFVSGVNYQNDSTFIWRTTDGGFTWQKVFEQLHGFIDQVKMISATEGIGLGDPVGGKWTILRTSDSGTTWSRITTEPLQINNELGLFHSLSTYVNKFIWFGTSVGNNSSGAVYRSTDAGVTWNRESIPSFVYGVWTICFIDSLNGVCGDTSLARSTDGGVTWSPLAGVPSGHWYDDLFSTVSVSAGNDLWAVVDKNVYRSTDKGLSWNICYTGINDTLTYASFVTVGDYTAGWITSIGEKIVSCNFYDPTTDVREIENGEIPRDFDLSQNYPNPFNPSTTFRYSIPTQSKVEIKVFDLLGKEIETLVNDEKPAGTYELTWNAENLPSGVYFYQLRSGEFISAKKMILLK